MTAPVIIGDATLYQGNCLDVLPQLAAANAVVTDPPYAEISRDYGRLSETDWRTLLDGVVAEVRRLVGASGSSIFILQANSETIGRTRPWLWEFMAHWSRAWNMPQDLWWWNIAAMPTVHAHERNGLMRPSVKALVWLGEPTCYRDQNAVLWEASDAMKAEQLENRALERKPSGFTVRPGRVAERVQARGGCTPFNLIPLANTESHDSGGVHGHGAATPLRLCQWLVSYLSRPGDVVLDPFMGSGTTGVACAQLGRRFIGVELEPNHFATACQRIANAQRQPSLFAMPG